ncbi:hypothetical protein [Candidatus Odyssella thessalonicensis]|uniref:hypothetical protein n=1 Tax=Candidatus Odyssella thessalonicensis TaxID=84647 RepID=UPI000225BEA4|nr:hypothetical protein [Candidatus Odyssella thessalonicensis]
MANNNCIFYPISLISLSLAVLASEQNVSHTSEQGDGHAPMLNQEMSPLTPPSWNKLLSTAILARDAEQFLPCPSLAAAAYQLSVSMEDLERDAHKGRIQAQLYLGRHYLTDACYLPKSINWLESAATQGNSEAALQLALIYKNNCPSKQSKKLSEYWLDQYLDNSRRHLRQQP